MEKPETIRAYLDAVALQIRWKRARPVVLRELECHLEEQRDAFAAEGAENAELRAVEEMGDPVAVGKELNRLHRPKSQIAPLLLAISLALAGAILRVVLTAGWEAYHRADPLRTGLAMALGCAALFAGYFLDSSRLSRRAVWVCAAALAAGGLTLVSSPVILGTPYAFQFVLLLYPAAYAYWAYFWRGRGWLGLAFAVLGGVVLCLICAAASDAFGLLLLSLTCLGTLGLSAWNDWFGIGRRTALLAALAVAAPCAAGTGCFLFRAMAQRLEQLSDPLWLAAILRSVAATARWLGEGAWEQTAYPFAFEEMVPGCSGDAFPNTLLYRLGWLPFLALVLVFTALTLRLLFRGLKLRTQLGRAVTLAVAVTLGTQAACSLAWNFGFPLFEASFPLLAGNTAAVLNLFLIGLALSALRTECIAQDTLCRTTESPLRFVDSWTQPPVQRLDFLIRRETRS